ncbi:hypothetical protein Trydic_g5330 [Trypoxylus dichotomus]
MFRRLSRRSWFAANSNIITSLDKEAQVSVPCGEKCGKVTQAAPKSQNFINVQSSYTRIPGRMVYNGAALLSPAKIAINSIHHGTYVSMFTLKEFTANEGFDDLKRNPIAGPDGIPGGVKDCYGFVK